MGHCFSSLEGDQEQQASRRVAFLDSTGGLIVQENNPFSEFGANSGPRAAAVTSDGRMLVFSAEEEDGSSLLVLWSMDLGAEAARFPLIGPFVPGDDPYGWGREYVSSIDIWNDRILVNVSAAESEHHPSRALLVGSDGSVVDLTAQSELAISAAAFLETRVLPNTR